MAAVLIGIVAVICCAGPALIAAVGVGALAAWLTKSVYVLIPAFLVGLGLVGLWRYRRRAGARSRDPVSRERGAKL